MTMYNRDFDLIAETINAIVVSINESVQATPEGTFAEGRSELYGIGKVVKDLAIEFSDIYPKFDAVKFRKACGFQ